MASVCSNIKVITSNTSSAAPSPKLRTLNYHSVRIRYRKQPPKAVNSRGHACVAGRADCLKQFMHSRIHLVPTYHSSTRSSAPGSGPAFVFRCPNFNLASDMKRRLWGVRRHSLCYCMFCCVCQDQCLSYLDISGVYTPLFSFVYYVPTQYRECPDLYKIRDRLLPHTISAFSP